MLKLFLILFTAAALATPVAGAVEEPAVPTPYSATYRASYRGFGMGKIHYVLHSPEPGKFIYASRADPRFLARIFVSDEAVERSVMHIDADGVRPLEWFREDGKPGEEEDGLLTFDWQDGRVRGTAEEDTVDLPTEQGLQDPMSIQIAVLTALLRNQEPGTVPLVDGDQIKRYRYVYLGKEDIETETGKYSTILYSASRPGSKRVSRVWHAPALGYIPVRAEQERKGRVEMVLELIGVEGRPVPPPEAGTSGE